MMALIGQVYSSYTGGGNTFSSKRLPKYKHVTIDAKTIEKQDTAIYTRKRNRRHEPHRLQIIAILEAEPHRDCTSRI